MMGTIARFDMWPLYMEHKIRHFAETGTGTGEAIAHQIANSVNDWEGKPIFKTLLSCEIDCRLADEANRRFVDDPRVHIFNTSSDVFLGWVCNVLPHDEPILFWLDAHFPGADYGLASYMSEQKQSVRLPLEDELRLIFDYRPAGKDVIICDDLRIYTDGPFGNGNVPPNVRPACPAHRGIEFVHEIMGKTHDVQELYEHEGYILITPREN